jgi:hypothetical protein
MRQSRNIVCFVEGKMFMRIPPSAENAARRLLAMFAKRKARPGEILKHGEVLTTYAEGQVQLEDFKAGCDYAIEQGRVKETEPDTRRLYAHGGRIFGFSLTASKLIAGVFCQELEGGQRKRPGFPPGLAWGVADCVSSGFPLGGRLACSDLGIST